MREVILLRPLEPHGDGVPPELLDVVLREPNDLDALGLVVIPGGDVRLLDVRPTMRSSSAATFGDVRTADFAGVDGVTTMPRHYARPHAPTFELYSLADVPHQRLLSPHPDALAALAFLACVTDARVDQIDTE